MIADSETIAELEPRMPVRGFSLSRPRIRTGDWADGGGFFPSKPHIEATEDSAECIPQQAHLELRSAPIWQVRGDKRTLRLVRPLLVQVRQEEGYFFAENSTLNLVGTGLTTQEALSDFGMHLIYFHHYYSALQENEVTGDAIRLRGLFRGLFVLDE